MILNPKNILICRLSAIGDCIETWPIAVALKRSWPDCSITWVVDCGVDSLLRGHPCIDEVIRLPKGWLKSPKLVWKLRHDLRRRAIDLAIDPQGLSKSSLLGWLSGAKRRVGFSAPIGKEIAPFLYTDKVSPIGKHLVDRQLELLEPSGVEKHQVAFGYQAGKTECEWWMRESRQVVHGSRYCVINPGAGWSSRMWSMERYGEVAKHLRRIGIAPLVLWGGTREYQLARQVVDLSEGNAVLAPDTTLLQLAAVLQASEFYLGSETGPMHLAAALGVACVSLHGPTNFEKSGPYGAQHQPIQKIYSPENRKTASNESMMAIGIDDVLEACDRIIKKLRPALPTAA
jgi:lipopolysaccharide heptosyltransferase I